MGLRVAYLSFSPALRSTLERGIYNINLKTPALNAEIITELINTDIAESLMQKRAALSKERNRIYDSYFPEQAANRNKLSYFRWLPLPALCNGNGFEQQVKRKGVRVYSSRRFAIGDSGPNDFIRIAISSPANSRQLEKGLTIIKDLLKEISRIPTTIILFKHFSIAVPVGPSSEKTKLPVHRNGLSYSKALPRLFCPRIPYSCIAAVQAGSDSL